jgi:serine/threonine protein kinase
LQTLNILEQVHQIGYTHCDIKPDNILLPKNHKSGTRDIYLIDFGLCQKFLNTSSEHLFQHKAKEINGNSHFMSINTMNKRKPRRKDDLESLFYTAVFMLKGDLPWGFLNKKITAA